MSNVNDSYFDGYYKDIWRSIIPDILTQREVDFIISYFQLNKESNVLDLMCGYGRHAIELAEKGIKVTAIDNLQEYTREVELKAAEKNLPIRVITGSVLDKEVEIRIKDKYELAICMGNSLNFFPPDELEKLLKIVGDHLKTGGHFLINSWSIAEIALQNFKEKSEQILGGFQFITESKLLSSPTRMESVTTMIPNGGHPETKTAVDYIYSIDELSNLFIQSGLSLTELFSIPGKKKFTEGEPRAYIITKKS
jgi:SAM-dependent methyltransferase